MFGHLFNESQKLKTWDELKQEFSYYFIITRCFQFKLFNNVLNLHKMLFKFGKVESPLCSFCNLNGETPYHLFYECSHTNYSWNQLRYFLSNSLNILPLTQRNVIFGLINQKEKFLIINHLLSISKLYTYNSRSSGKLNIGYLKTIIYKTKNIESEASKTAIIRKQKYINNWLPIRKLTYIIKQTLLVHFV